MNVDFYEEIFYESSSSSVIFLADVRPQDWQSDSLPNGDQNPTFALLASKPLYPGLLDTSPLVVQVFSSPGFWESLSHPQILPLPAVLDLGADELLRFTDRHLVTFMLTPGETLTELTPSHPALPTKDNLSSSASGLGIC
jgi:hypothetical protein